MSNTLAAYNPTFYANEALIQLEKALGLAGRVHRGHDKNPKDKGDTITISAPATFVAQDAPSTAQDVTAGSLSITLDQWKEVKFSLTDKELSFTKEKIIEDHIRPAAYALADKVDQYMAGLMWKGIPWYTDFTSTPVASDITAVRKVMRNRNVPLDNAGLLHFMVNGDIEEAMLNVSAFTQHSGAGETGVNAQESGLLGRKYGFNFFTNQNTPNVTSATVADVAGAINNGAGYAAGIKSIVVDGMTTAGEFQAGDIVLVTGHTQQYVLTSAVTLSGGGGTLAIFGSQQVQGGGLESAVTDDQVVTIVLSGGSGTTKAQNLAFHRNCAALAMAPLSDLGNQLGAKIATISDPITNLSIRSRLFYDGDNSKVVIALDCLFGGKVLNGNLGVRARK